MRIKLSNPMADTPGNTEINPLEIERSCLVCGITDMSACEGDEDEKSSKFKVCKKCKDKIKSFLNISAPPGEQFLEDPMTFSANNPKLAQISQNISEVLTDLGVEDQKSQNLAQNIEKEVEISQNQKKEEAKNKINQIKKNISGKKYGYGDEPGRVWDRFDRVPEMAEASDDEKDTEKPPQRHQNCPRKPLNRGKNRPKNPPKTLILEVISALTNELEVQDIKELGEELGMIWETEKFTPADLHKGYIVELEHGTVNSETNVTDNDPIETLKIAWAHLKEDPRYYDYLEDMEDKMKETSEF